MTDGEQAAAPIDQRNGERSAVFQSQRQRRADGRGLVGVGPHVDGSFDAMEARDRHPGAFEHPLIPTDLISDPAKDRAVLHQLAAA